MSGLQKYERSTRVDRDRSVKDFKSLCMPPAFAFASCNEQAPVDAHSR
jgi:hypothetical protein